MDTIPGELSGKGESEGVPAERFRGEALAMEGTMRLEVSLSVMKSNETDTICHQTDLKTRLGQGKNAQQPIREE